MAEGKIINDQFHLIPNGLKYLAFDYLWQSIVYDLTRLERERKELMQRFVENNWHTIGDGNGTGLYSRGDK